MDGDLAVELSRLEQQGRTGVLSAGDGEFHFAEGAIAIAYCRRATGLDRLTVEAGVATPQDWQRAGDGDPGPLLERSRLETLAVLSVYDAAYFLLASPATALEFRPGTAHWLARICRVRPRDLLRECARRDDHGRWPVDEVDRAPVVPVRRVRRQRVVLTAGQAEILAAADARRSVTEIARDLGRTTYGCLRAVRELTEAGLIEPPARDGQPATPATLVPARPVVGATGDASHPAPAAADPKSSSPLPVRRRTPHIAPVVEADRWEPVDVNLLVRVRAALEELE